MTAQSTIALMIDDLAAGLSTNALKSSQRVV
jgi:hypothetical protein